MSELKLTGVSDNVNHTYSNFGAVVRSFYPKLNIAAALKTGGLLASLSLVTGCSLTGLNSDSNSNAPDQFGMANPVSAINRTMANDLSEVAAQIFDPVSTTLQVNTAEQDSLRDFFIAQFSEKGYGVQQVNADQGSNYFSYNRQEIDSDGQPKISFSTTIGAVVISRDYLVPEPNVVIPASTFRLSGTRAPVNIIEKTTARKQIKTPSYSAVTYIASLNLDEQAPVISLITSDLVNQVAIGQSNAPTFQALNSSNVEVNNLFYADASTFSSLLDDRRQVDRQIIVFGNDSMILGNTNKLLIDQFVDNRVSNRDVISLVGCSNGPTALEIGNEGLALGRARRVTQALLARGVARDRILDEGCWAPVSAGDKFPSRGVVLELWRAES